MVASISATNNRKCRCFFGTPFKMLCLTSDTSYWFPILLLVTISTPKNPIIPSVVTVSYLRWSLLAMIWSQQCSTPSRNKISKDDKDQYNNDGAFLNPGILGSMSIQEFLNNSHAMSFKNFYLFTYQLCPWTSITRFTIYAKKV